MSNRNTRPEHRARNPMRTIEAFDAPREYEVNGNNFLLIAPNDVRTAATIKNHTQDYPILFNKLREMIKDDDTINKDAEGLPVVHFHKYTELLLNTFNELGIKWRTSDKLWIKNPDMITSVPYVKIYPEKQVGTAKSGQNYDKLRDNTIREASTLTTSAASLPAPPTMATMSVAAPPIPPANIKSRNYHLGYSTEIIAVKKNTNDKKKQMFVVDDKQNCIYDFYEWRQQSFDYDNKIPEPGPVGYIKGPNMPQPLFNWKTYRDTSFIKGESQRDLPNIFNDRGQEIGGLFVYLELKDGFEVEFFPEPEPEREKILLKRIKYKKSRKGTKNRKEKSYLKSKDSNDYGDFDIYTDPHPENNDDDYFVIYADDSISNEKPRKIGEMDSDDGFIRFDEHGIDSEDDENESMNYPHEFVTLYQESPKTIKKNQALSQANKELEESKLGGFFGAGWTVSWDSEFKDIKGKKVGGLLFENKNWFINAEDRLNGDHVFERYMDDVLLYDTEDNGSGIIKKNLDKFLTEQDKIAGWIAVYSKSKFKTYYFNRNTNRSVWQYKDITHDGQITGGKRKTKRKTNRRNRTLKK